MKTYIRDETEHGVEYVLASEVDDAIADSKAIARNLIESLKDHCREVNPTWAWLMREVLEIVDPK